RGPPNMSIAPVERSATILKKISPCGVTTVYRPSSPFLSSRQNIVAHLGRLSILERKSNTLSFGASMESVRVLLRIGWSPLLSYIGLYARVLTSQTGETPEKGPDDRLLLGRAFLADLVLESRQNALGRWTERMRVGTEEH